MTPNELDEPLQEVSWRGDGLFDCTNDCPLCLKTCCLPCITFGETRAALHGGEIPPGELSPACKCCLISAFTMTLCTWAYTMRTRYDIRSKYDLPAKPCNDCFVHFFCWPVALCQERRELKKRPLTTWPTTTENV